MHTPMSTKKGNNSKKCLSMLSSPPLKANKRPRSQPVSLICEKNSYPLRTIRFNILIHIPAMHCLARGFSLGTVVLANRFSAVCNQI